MNILVNATNLKLGGGVQVADSVINEFQKFSQHKFYFVYSDYLKNTAQRINTPDVIKFNYNITNSLRTLIWGRDDFLDRLVEENDIDCVLTIFGPSRWNPKCPHISGFAMPHLVLPDSPFFSLQHGLSKVKSHLRLRLVERAFKNSTKFFYTENKYISDILSKKWKGYQIVTINNYYNQVFDTPNKWQNLELPYFEGTTLLTISANYPHKNLPITIDIAHILKSKYPDFSFRFVLTIDENSLNIPEGLEKHFLLLGKVDITQCPSLYNQSDITFLPTLLECFSATYPESMRMGVPILTTDMEFARGLCEDAALYYSPLNANEAADIIYKLSIDSNLRSELIRKGKDKLSDFDNSETRAVKLIRYCERIVNQTK